ncbi:glycoside hydrolase family 2 TIM barrel-domain containing protein [Streptomyces sp. NPDC001978]|uniref:glycoside hydrolase family 2 protein n=1 Tax=Streptomyces sp. NPDC001978 TaxID=3364627 RepID=UPI003674DC69
MLRQTLHDGWQLSATTGPVPAHLAGRTVPARVPGSAHLDLLAAGLIPDPYLDRAEEELAWAHRTGWRYALTFDAAAPAPDQRADLAFDGLDTVATIELNGQLLGTTANMHRSYRFDARKALRAGTNELVVSFRSALEYAEEMERRLGRRSGTYPHPFNMVRKMACSFGWDWGPDLQTAGIWKPVRLERWATARLARVRPLVTVADDGTGRVEVHAEIERAGIGEDGELALAVRAKGREARVAVPVGVASAMVTLEIPDVALWWPDGYGDQPLYDLAVELRDGAGAQLDAATRRIGFRTVTVDVTPDEIGTPFTFVVNDKPVFVKGANWIPDDHFLTRITRERLAHRVDQALGAHINLLRVWGGGIYETEDFYDICDERGLLVWQDFPFACAAYPEEEPLRSEVEAEAREHVTRLASHPSLALWNGANENMWGYRDWGWRAELEDRTWGYGYYTDLLPRIVAELDPTRFYAANSPYSPGLSLDQVHPNDENHGTRHEWQVWNTTDYTAYREHIPRFCSEFGFQAPPTWATLTRWIHDEPLTPISPAFLLHQKAEDGNGKLDRGFAPHLPRPAGFTDWHWTTQLNQARAVTFGIEHFRSWWPRTAGAVVWQLNDCWPVTSWAAVDGDGRPKPLWYTLRHAYAPRLLTIQPRDGRATLIAVNDTDTAWTGTVRVERQSFHGDVKETIAVELDAAPRSVAQLAVPETLLSTSDPKREVVVATSREVRAVHLFLEDLELAYDPRPLTAQATAAPGGYRVDVSTTSLARDVALLADRLAPDAEVDDMLVTLLAGETHSFFVRTAARLDPAELTGPLVLRTANDLGDPTRRT